MKSGGLTLLIVSSAVVLVLVGGGLGLRVGAADGSYGQVVVFSEILSLVMDNYVDEVETDRLLSGAYEGMLGGLDSHGAFLTPGEVDEWKATREAGAAPGLRVLKMFGTIQVVGVEPGSPADLAGVVPGDQVRSLDERPVRDLSLDQVFALLEGPAGSRIKLGLLRPSQGFEREEIVVERGRPAGPAYAVEVVEGIAVLKVIDLARVELDALAATLDELRRDGVERLLLDLRNLVDRDPRTAIAMARVFAPGQSLELRDREGQVLETIDPVSESPAAWSGATGVLVNGFTAGAGEALAALMRDHGGAVVYGESTFGLGAEPKLFELPDGSGLVFSAAVWKTGSGGVWNEDGIEPDQEVAHESDDFEEGLADQLRRTLEVFGREEPVAEDKAA
jgi:carboxyl-terminal processing protease